MYEVEIKFKIGDLQGLKSNLLNKGCILSDNKHQKDSVFIHNINNTDSTQDSLWIRLREVNGKTELNLKKQSKEIMASKEIEFEVNNFNKAYDFLETLGLKKWVTVQKDRITTSYKGFNICIDCVDRLGNFVEIETFSDDINNLSFYEEQILTIATSLGIDINSRVNKHYDTMINELDN